MKIFFLLFSPKWSTLHSVFSITLYDRTFVSIFGVYGFIVGLRIRLIGDSDMATKLIRGDQLVLSGIFLMMSGIVWKFSELINYFSVPDEIRDTPTISKYIDEKKKTVFSQEYFDASYDEHSSQWNDINEKSKRLMRFIISSVIIFALLLGLLSLAALVVSTDQFLLGSWHLLTAPDELSGQASH